MGTEGIDMGDALDLEQALIALERIASAGGHLGDVARRATGAVLEVVDVMSPTEVEVEWIGDDDPTRCDAREEV